MRVLVIGCGYLGMRAAQAWRADGHAVAALTRSTERAAAWQAAGLEAVVGDVTRPATLRTLPSADLCLYAVGYDRRSAADRQSVSVGGVGHVLREIRERVERLIFVSSTSVYGQCRGEIVDEDSPCVPASEGGRICLEAEKLAQDLFDSAHPERPAVILRLAGLYGPGRLIARARQLRERQPIAAHPEAWLNLIHVDDAAQAIVQLASRPDSGCRYLLSDGHPVRRREFYNCAARLIGAAPPEFVPPDDSLNKRCDSSRVRSYLGREFRRFDAANALPAAFQEQSD